MSDPVFAQVALERLQDAGLSASLTNESTAADLHLGFQRPVIWVADEADLAPGRRVIAALESARTESSCPRCGYALAAHSGVVTCPECGGSVHAEAQPVVCAQCGEEVPANFESCWSCGARTEGAPAAVVADASRQAADADRGDRAAFVFCVLVLVAAAAVTLAIGIPAWLGLPSAMLAAVVLFFLVRRRRPAA